jgi:uncharacterized pyridoxal phosphate-containing UPF0001 family protein
VAFHRSAAGQQDDRSRAFCGHGVDRLKIAIRLSAQRCHYAPPLNVCLQVNMHATRKAGIETSAVEELAIAVTQLRDWDCAG